MSALPESIGPYRVERELARGGMGAVYAVTHTETGAACVLKTLLTVGAGAEDRERFRREAELMAQLDHPHVARIHAAKLDGPTPYLIQELLPGGTLRDRLRDGPLTPAEACRITAALASGLAHAHERGILHRDLKPGNVLFNERDEPLLVDFGLAVMLGARERLTETGTIMGTPGYMAPEQALGSKEVDPRTDVYGLGAVLYAMLTGRPPFQGGSLLALLDRVATQAPRSPRALNPGVPEWLSAVCLRSLAKDPAERFPDALSFAAALAPPAHSGSSRARPVLGVFVVAVVAAVGLVALSVTTGPPPAAPGPQSAASPTPPPPTAPPTPAPPRWFSQLSTPPPLPQGVSVSSTPNEYLNHTDGSVLVWIAQGSLRFGGLRPGSAPIPLAGFFLGKTEVTWAQYRDYCAARNQPLPEVGRRELAEPDGPRRPARGLSWQQARAYCAWAGGRLPLEDEWAYAAEGATLPRLQPAPTRTVPVGSRPDVSRWGCRDMAENVSEWVGASIPLLSAAPDQWMQRAHRGGSFAYPTQDGVATRKQSDRLGETAGSAGLRLCVPVSPEPRARLAQRPNEIKTLWEWCERRPSLETLRAERAKLNLAGVSTADIQLASRKDSAYLAKMAELFARGDRAGMAYLARGLLSPQARPCDESLGLWLLVHAAWLGEPKAAFWLGQLFESGRSFPQALTCYELSLQLKYERGGSSASRIAQTQGLTRSSALETRRRFERLGYFWFDAAPRKAN